MANSSQNGSSSQNSDPPFLSPEYYKEPDGLVVARLTFEVTLVVVGVLGNILVCVVIARMRTKTSMNRYLFNLVIADIGVLLVVSSHSSATRTSKNLLSARQKYLPVRVQIRQHREED